LLGTVLALEILDATALVGAVLGTAGVLGVAIGFAFKDLAENSLASVLLSLRQPFSPNDHVVIDGNEGKVVRLTSRATILLTLDGNHLRIPNAAVFKAIILNYTKNPERRFSFSVGVDTEESLPPAQELALETLRQSPGVLATPQPQCLVEELGDSTVNLQLVGWVDQEKAEYLKVKSEAIRRVKEAFDEAEVFMPEPIYKVRLEQTEPAAKKKKKLKVSAPTSADQPDVSPETHLEQRIEEERVTEEDDLLSQSAKQE
jgi:small-conductance mechanosensitive channel